jgi:Xaa-Pro aminopeptidase
MRPNSALLLKKAGLPALLISNLTNIRYLTGLSLSAGLVLILPARYMLFVDGRYMEMARRNAYKGVLIKDVKDAEKILKKIRRCGFEEDDVTISRLSSWKRKFKSSKFVRSKGIVEYFRRAKDPEELSKLRRALRITDELLHRVPRLLKPGTSEHEVAWKLEAWARELGAEGLSFEAIVAFGSHTSRPHHRPTERKLKKGELVQIDVGARYKGYCGDRSEVFFTKKPTPEERRAYEAVTAARDTSKELVEPGVSVRALDQVARVVFKKYKMDKAFLHSLGHGVGLDIHEGVNLSVRSASDDRLLKNEVITIEPGVYFPGRFGMRLEDMVFVK